MWLSTTWCDFSVSPPCHGDDVTFPAWCDLSTVLVFCKVFLSQSVPWHILDIHPSWTTILGGRPSKTKQTVKSHWKRASKSRNDIIFQYSHICKYNVHIDQFWDQSLVPLMHYIPPQKAHITLMSFLQLGTEPQTIPKTSKKTCLTEFEHFWASHFGPAVAHLISFSEAKCHPSKIRCLWPHVALNCPYDFLWLGLWQLFEVQATLNRLHIQTAR